MKFIINFYEQYKFEIIGIILTVSTENLIHCMNLKTFEKIKDLPSNLKYPYWLRIRLNKTMTGDYIKILKKSRNGKLNKYEERVKSKIETDLKEAFNEWNIMSDENIRIISYDIAKKQ